MDVQQAVNLLKVEGHKLTNKREDLIRFFSEEKRYLSAREVLDEMKNSYPGLSFDTIYRNLALFSDLGILEETELEGERRFRINCSTTGHHHHLICIDCGVTKTIIACPMEKLTGAYTDFHITGHKFEIYGFCSSCQPKRQENS